MPEDGILHLGGQQQVSGGEADVRKASESTKENGNEEKAS